MKIAVLTGKEDGRHIIPSRIEDGGFLNIYQVNDDDLTYHVISQEAFNANGLAELGKVIDEKCEAIITGVLDNEVFAMIADAGITRFNGGGMRADIALERMNQHQLSLFSHAEGEVHEHENGHQHDDGHECEGCGACHSQGGIRAIYFSESLEAELRGSETALDEIIQLVLDDAQGCAANADTEVIVVEGTSLSNPCSVEYRIVEGAARIEKVY